jgi:hypothetical protein
MTPEVMMTQSDRIFPYLQVVSLVITIVLLAASRILFFFPDDTDTMFAWKITSHMTSYLIAAGYFGGAYFFANVALFGRRLKWHEVRLAIFPVTAFTITMAIITIVHWEKFNYDIFPGQLWNFLYFTLPFVLPAIWLHHQRQMRGSDKETRSENELVDKRLRQMYFTVGIFLFVYGCILFIFPSTIIPTWPWPVTSVTTMAIGGWLILPGVAGMTLPLDSRPSAWRLLVQAQILSVALILVSMVLARDELENKLFTYVFAAALMFIIGMLAAILANIRARRSTD